MTFYVYQLLRPWNNVPCYVGKGSGLRHAHHAKLGVNHYNAHLASIFKKAGGPLPIVMIAEGLSEDDAFALEIKLIAEIGRKDQGKGPLANWTDGGEGTVAITDETRAKRSASIKATWTPERLQRASDMQRGKRQSDESKAKLRVTSAARVQSEQEKAKRRSWWTPERRAARAALETPERRAEASARSKAILTRKAPLPGVQGQAGVGGTPR